MKTTETESEYQARELRAFDARPHAFFDSIRDFAETLAGMNIPEQIEWIENGTYGAGACLALQRAAGLADSSPRMNGKALVGNAILAAFYGKTFTGWQRLPEPVRQSFDAAVAEWMTKPHEFALIRIA